MGMVYAVEVCLRALRDPYAYADPHTAQSHVHTLVRVAFV